MPKYICKNCGKASYTSCYGVENEPCIYCDEVALEQAKEK